MISPRITNDGLDPCTPEHHIHNMNESNTPNRFGNPLVTLLYCIPSVILLIAVVFLWRNHSDNKDQLEHLTVQNQQLQQELTAAKAKINDFNSGDSSLATRERLATMRNATTSTPEKEVETLVLQPPTVHQTDKGLVVRFEFRPVDGVELPDDIILAVRVPRSSASKILAMAPVSAPENANVRAVINPAGYIGFIQGSPADMGALAFEFTVSAPVKATVSGSAGIIDYEFDITPDACTVRKL